MLGERAVEWNVVLMSKIDGLGGVYRDARNADKRFLASNVSELDSISTLLS